MDDRGLERALQAIFGREHLRRLVDKEARAIADALRTDGEGGLGPDGRAPMLRRLPDGRLIAYVGTFPPTVYVIDEVTGEAPDGRDHPAPLPSQRAKR